MPDPPDLLHARLTSHLLAGNRRTSAHEVVSHFGAVQAQDYLGALWAIGTRMEQSAEGDVERAISERRIVRCWPMRGTLHFVAAGDVRWMLDLLAPRVLARHRGRLQRDFGLDRETMRRCYKKVEAALRNGGALTRPELYALLDDAGITTAGSRGLHILFTLAHEKLICFGARRGKQPTFVLLDEWLPAAPPRPRDEALAELARRYFSSHGPAALPDFVWWSGLTMKEANEAVRLAGSQLERATVDGTTLISSSSIDVSRRRRGASVELLPPFDEYTVAYKDRSAVIDAAHSRKLNAGGGMLNAVIVVNGRVTGTWKRHLRRDDVEITASLFRQLTARETHLLEKEATRYAAFVGRRTAVIAPALTLPS